MVASNNLAQFFWTTMTNYKGIIHSNISFETFKISTNCSNLNSCYPNYRFLAKPNCSTSWLIRGYCTLEVWKFKTCPMRIKKTLHGTNYVPMHLYKLFWSVVAIFFNQEYVPVFAIKLFPKMTKYNRKEERFERRYLLI